MMKNPQQALKRSWILLGLGVFVYVVSSLFLMEQGQTPTLIIGSKNFTESLLIGELYAQTLERAGYKVQRKFNLGGTLIAHEALKRGQIDLYPEYTGTAFLDILHQTPDKNFALAYRRLNDSYRQRWQLRWLTPSAADNSQALALRRETANRLHLTTLSQLSKVAPKLILASIPEFEERSDGLQGLMTAYGGFHFKRIDLYDNGLKYQVLTDKRADVAVAFTTDGALTNPKLVVMKDDAMFWPSYRVAPVLRQAALDRMPPLEGLLDAASAKLNTAVLRRLNAEVDIQHQDPRTVIRRFLSQSALSASAQETPLKTAPVSKRLTSAAPMAVAREE